jgi:hypothetical protein
MHLINVIYIIVGEVRGESTLQRTIRKVQHLQRQGALEETYDRKLRRGTVRLPTRYGSLRLKRPLFQTQVIYFHVIL